MGKETYPKRIFWVSDHPLDQIEKVLIHPQLAAIFLAPHERHRNWDLE
jgi:hypothetical protein